MKIRCCLVAVMACASVGLSASAWADPALMSRPMSLKEMVDPAIGPCNDFYQYVCKNWQAANPIPEDQSRWGQFQELREANLAKMRELLEGVGTDATPEAKRVGDFYASCMDEAGIDAKGAGAIKPVLDKIDGLTGRQDLVPLLAALHGQGVGAFFAFGSAHDPDDSEHYIAGADQDGLGLPDRDFYFRKDEKAAHQREAYVTHVEHMFVLAGEQPEAAASQAKAVMALETAMAGVSLDRVARRDPQKVNKPMAFVQFSGEAQGFDWTGYARELGAPAFERINDQSSDYLAKIGGIVAAASLDDIKSYLKWHVLHSSARLLPKAFVDENFDFYGRTLSGQPVLQPRWKRCVQMTDHALGENLGQLFVAKYYPPDAKKRTGDLVAAVHDSFGRILAKVEWMAPATRAKAQAKLAMMASKIGYPDHWRDYSSVSITRDDALGNYWRANTFETKRDLHKIGTVVDRSEWEMTPPTVNAYYSAETNDINFPAGILQFPFFDKDADDGLNFGAIGMVIGHEMTHGFDDEGRQYDGKGNLADWWTKEDAKRFGAKSQCLVDQYGSYAADGDVKQNGNLTLGENTADNGGARIAYWALEKYLAGKKVGKIDGWTQEQRFFLGMARVWCESARPEVRRLQAQTDPHSLSEYRVNGTLSNMPEFARAFGCKPTDPMVRKEPCKVW
ncbi:M13 family metallopeptidase [Telmatospirillum sp.]|uniref:M13 family metallopeptidase n=1 Tax=Telmatospirillum sp. TaxID=2079197 RepID=UPI0028481F8F|nr:M13 family metallopeptidase [Telmatospirillum sp.]MDR3439344.1 M13 family metallopeptidase [Telmatospirillum sp.]